MAEQTAYSTEYLDHLSVVAGICRKIELIERVDMLVSEDDRSVSVRQAAQEIVLNGLGFVSHPLCLSGDGSHRLHQKFGRWFLQK